MNNKDLVLGIDTSNYTTSIAFTDINKEILVDSRRTLVVKQGERGLRQSHALFQHMENLPEMVIELISKIDKERIGAVAVTSKPRPVEGSYMPVFNTGLNYGKVIAASLGVPLYEFSHQEGHLKAAKHQSSFINEKEFLAYHLSGGTSELLSINKSKIEIIGGSKDISFGQLIDRIGVSLNMTFPAGKEMDMLAVKTSNNDILNCPINLLKKIPIDGLYINLSGIETQCQRLLLQDICVEGLIYELFLKICDCLCQLTEKAFLQTGCNKVLFSGGVSASRFIRTIIIDRFRNSDVIIEFGNPTLSSDNAVGISLLGGEKLWA